MKKFYLLFIGLVVVLPIFSQINFKPGFYVTNEGDSVECLIKDVDWRNNPELFEVKMADQSIKTFVIDDIKAFGIDTSVLFIRSTVMLDTSGNNLSTLSEQRNPEWKEVQVFLKVLLNGKASLYLYKKGELFRFFYSIDQGEIIQLVYKEYYTNNRNHVSLNSYFQQQLINDVNCNSTIDAANIRYIQKQLLKYFRKYNSCKDYSYTDFTNKIKRDYLNFKLSIGADIASLDVSNSVSDKYFLFDNYIGYEFGFETEVILPFNRNKIRIVILPTIHISNANTEYTPLGNYTAYVTTNYSSIDYPIGFRYYSYLTDKTKLFFTGLFVPIYTFKSSSLEVESKVKQEELQLDLSSRFNLSFGAGVSYKRFSLEARYNTNREITSSYSLWKSNLQNYSVKLGYDLFKL